MEDEVESFEKLFSSLKKHIRVLIECKDFNTSQIRNNLRFIQKNTRFNKDKILNKRVNEFIVDCGISHVFNNVIITINQSIKLAWPSLKPNDNGIPCKSLEILLSIIWNCSDKSLSLCNSLVCSNVIKEFISQLNNRKLVETLSTDTKALYACKAYLGILHNIVRNAFNSVPLFRSCDTVAVLRRYIDCGTNIVNTKALLIASYVTNETENKLINADSANIQFLVEILTDSLKNIDHYSSKYCFWSHEILCGLNHLSVNESNKRRILEAGVLIAYKCLLIEYLTAAATTPTNSPSVNDLDLRPFELRSSGCTKPDICTDKQLLADQTNPNAVNVWTDTAEMTALECRLSIKGLWSLSFDSKCRSLILSDDFFIKALEKIALLSENEQIRKEVRGALWVLNSETRVRVDLQRLNESTRGSKGHVMLSYPWRYQQKMLIVRDTLKLAGYKIWMDIDNMTGSTLEAMALAVEHCEVFVVAMSQSYKDSPSCRTEAEYAYQLRKSIVPLMIERDYAPDGWLGLLVGSKLYFDISDDRLLAASLPKIINELADRGRYCSPNVTTHSILDNTDNVEPRSKHLYRSTSPNIKQWTNTEVCDWLISNDLNSYVNKMQGFNGKYLFEFKKMLKNGPEFFYKQLEILAENDLISMLKFTHALDKLSVN